MSEETNNWKNNTEENASSLFVELMLGDFDELIELDYVHGRMRNLKHTEGKLFAPVIDSTIRDVRRYSAENMLHPDDVERYLRESDPATAKERIEEENKTGFGVHRERYRFKQLGGGWRWMEQVAIGGEKSGIPSGTCYIFLIDVQDKVEKEQGITDGESGDDNICVIRNELTGLMTEDAFSGHSKQLIEEHPEGWCVLAVDLERFKLFNEWYGRKNGDLLLAQIGGRIEKLEQKTGGAACYLGQDDFFLLMPCDKKEIETLYDDIHELIKEYGTSVGFMPALGVAMVDGKCTVEELCDRASLAARYAKENFQNRIRTFEDSMYQQTERDYQLLSDFQDALQNRELFIMLQPQCKISTRRVVGAESLVRWRKADGTMISPGIFVPVLERYGFVTDLDKYVWEEVCIWQRKWIDGGHKPLPVSVNVSQIDIFTIDVPAYFEELVKKYDLPVDVIKVEITESAYVDNESVINTVQHLRDKGFLVLMDDFGSGYSSLNMLRNINVDIIKLDAQFLRMDSGDAKGMYIMESIVNMAKTMGVPIIVEGVETQEETNFLSGLGCSYVQGYFFYRPMPVEDFEKLIGESANIDTRGFLFKRREQFRTEDFLDKNVFSDVMLNNILGPVGFFLWHEDDVDITRYNQQLVREIDSPAFKRHMESVQQLMPPEEVPELYALLRRAMKDPLNGSMGELRFRREDGGLMELQIRFFFMDEGEIGKRFYGSVRNVTQINRLTKKMNLLSRTSNDCVAFLFENDGAMSAQVAINGMEDVLGLSLDELERELNDGAFQKRIHPDDRDWLRKLMQDSAMRLDAFSPPFRIESAAGGYVTLRMGLDSVEDKDCGVKYLMILRQVEEDTAILQPQSLGNDMETRS